MRSWGALSACLLLAAGCGSSTDDTTTSTRPDEVTVRTLELSRGPDRPLPTTLYVPAGDGPFPAVVFSHGFTRRPEDYDQLLRAWAAAGFVVAAPVFPKTARGAADEDIDDLVEQPADVSEVLTAVLALDETVDDRAAAAGHSLGGMTTLGTFTMFRDERLRAGIVLAGNSRAVGEEYRGPPASLLFVHGRRDDVITFDSGKAVYDAVTWPKALLDLPEGDHLDPYLARDDEQFAAVEQVTTDFLRWTLQGDEDARDRLADDAGPAGQVEDRL